MTMIQTRPSTAEERDNLRSTGTQRMKVLAVGAQKGGVGKSTSSLYLATRAAERLGGTPAEPAVGILDRDESKNLSRLLKRHPGLLGPGVVLLEGEELPAASSGLRLVVIDTPPGVSAVESLRAAHLLVVPVLPEEQGVLNLVEYLKNIEAQRITLSPNIRLLALLPTMVQRRLTLHRLLLEQIDIIGAAHKPRLPVLPPVPRRSKIAEYDLSAPEYDAASEELFTHAFL